MRIDIVVLPVDPLDVRTEAPLPRHVERQVHAEPRLIGDRIDQARERASPGQREVVALGEVGAAAPGPAGSPSIAAATAGAVRPALFTSSRQASCIASPPATISSRNPSSTRLARGRTGSTSRASRRDPRHRPSSASIRPWLSMMPVDGDSSARLAAQRRLERRRLAPPSSAAEIGDAGGLRTPLDLLEPGTCESSAATISLPQRPCATPCVEQNS